MAFEKKNVSLFGSFFVFNTLGLIYKILLFESEIFILLFLESYGHFLPIKKGKVTVQNDGHKRCYLAKVLATGAFQICLRTTHPHRGGYPVHGAHGVS